MPDVSVIVPVFRPGSDIDALLASLAGQTLPADRFEVILVDDGSGDGTPERLRALTAAQPNVRVEAIPPSGWPSRPRNVGLDLARAPWVFFADQDDRLDPEALERLLARAEEDGADVVVGKVVGHGKPVPRPLFAENRQGVTLEWEPLVRLLTPHKLFRKALLDEHAIRFPEDGERLEDHVFCLQVYSRTRRVSVLADHPVYHWIRHGHGRNASYQGVDERYFQRIRQILDIVDAYAAPGPLRDQLYAHYLRSKLLGRLSGRTFLRRPAEANEDLYASIRRLVVERFAPEVDHRLALRFRLIARLVRDDRFEGLRALARFESRLRAHAVLRGSERAGEAEHLRLEVGLRSGTRPLRVQMRGVELAWRPPGRLGEALGRTDVDLAPALRRATVDVLLVSEEDGSEFKAPARVTVRLDPVRVPGTRFVAIFVVEVAVDPRTAAAGGPLRPGRWRLRLSPILGGFAATTQEVRRAGRPEAEPIVLEVLPGGRLPAPPEPPQPPRPLARAARAVLRRARAAAGAAPRQETASRAAGPS